MTTVDVDRYLARIGLPGVRSAGRVPDLAWLTILQQAHMTTVPFENLDVFARRPVTTEVGRALDKIVDRNRGGWCFELNGAFAAFLEALGFRVGRLGAAVLLDGPTDVVDHLALEVMLDEPFLVDVGFGDSFRCPLRLNRRGPQDGGGRTFEFMASPRGLTLTRHDETGCPEAQYRFTRVHHDLADFAAACDALQADRTLHWSQKPFATRLLDGGPDRVTLLRDRLTVRRGDTVTVDQVAADEWEETLERWFSMNSPGHSAG